MSTRANNNDELFWGDVDNDVALQRYRTLVNTVNDGIYQLDADGRFVAVNNIIVELTGYTREELLGKHASIVLEDDDIEQIGREINNCLESQRELNRTFEFIARTINDEPIPCEVQMSLLIEDGNFEGTVGIVRDISERKQAEKAITKRERQLQRERDLTNRILQTSPIGIMVLDRNGEIVRVNERCKSLLEIDDVETYSPSDRAVYDEDRHPISINDHPFVHVLETGEPIYDRVLQIELPSGDHRWLSINATPLLSDDGTIDRVITTGEDVTELKEREEELKSELQDVFGRISDAFYALDEEWRFTHVNDRTAEIMKQSKNELLGREVWEVFPDAPDVFRENFQQAMDTQETINFEVLDEGRKSWFEFNVYPSETGLSIYFRDITERKNREQALAKFETIVETVNDGIYVKDDDGRFTMVNNAYAELTGYDREELIGEHASLVVDETTIEQAKETKEEMANDDASNPTLEAMIQTADNHHVPTEGTFATIETPDGESEQVGVVRDITERKEYQRKIEESEHRYRTLAENFPNGIVALFNEDLQYVAAGGELIAEIGINREEAIGESVYERYPDEIIEQIEPYFQAALKGEENSFEVEYYDRNLQAHTLPINSTGENRTGMLVVQDVTERREYQRKLEESNERLEQFAYAASHDLQEPLRMVTSYLQLLEKRYTDDLDEDAQEFIEFAVDGAERMRNMIEGLLQYSRVETQGDPFEQVDLNTIIEDVREDLQFQILESNADITTESLPVVEGDYSQLRQLFQNFLENAIAYSGDKPPQIHISAEQKGRVYEIAVHDHGIGIEPEQQERIFEVFQRLHTHNEHEGTGIGLALCERIVERHGGKIWVESEPDEGSTFLFTLPLGKR